MVLLQNSKGEYGVAQQNTPEKNWGFIQGRIEEGETYFEAAVREPREEASIEPHMCEFVSGCLHTGEVPSTHAGVKEFPLGAWYACVGMRLRPGFDVRPTCGPDGHQELLDWQWLGFNTACTLLLNQPGATLRTGSTLSRKTHGIMIPALGIMESLSRW